MKNRFISTTELAKLLGISHVAVYKKIKTGRIKAMKVGRNYVIDKNDLGGILDDELTETDKRMVEKAVKRTVGEYGETLDLLRAS
ncbi:helix-turn-helix domain-containing protein [Patescibacteria group bacterium]|nr:helix-turn-helix domain-containing protein [Patescibacteria group bacterium]MBU1199998.1 helix-turn-helix domain-containing protein [Patescibacteria group bacterium]MBU1457713.1 helix-turn-helix domain-containing protein [Patescibacteria group bacterium]